jgi:transcriptional repressor NrdR
MLKGILAACHKRSIRLTLLEKLADNVHSKIVEQSDREIRSDTLGEMVMDSLKTIDSVAYVRFASVYREFKDLSDFVKSLETLLKPVKKGGEDFAKLPEPIVPNQMSPRKVPPQNSFPQTSLFPSEATGDTIKN